MRAAPRTPRASSAEVKRSSHAAMIARSSGQCSRRATGVAKRGSSASSGRSRRLRSRGQRSSTPTIWSATHASPTGWTSIPLRGPGYDGPSLRTLPKLMSSAPISASSIDTSRCAPRPVRSRRRSAATTAPNACVPARMSAAWRYRTRGGSSSPRSRCMRPDVACTTWAKAGTVPPGPRLAVSGDGAVHEVGPDLGRGGVVQPETRHDTRPEVLDDHVRDPDEVQGH